MPIRNLRLSYSPYRSGGKEQPSRAISTGAQIRDARQYDSGRPSGRAFVVVFFFLAASVIVGCGSKVESERTLSVFVAASLAEVTDSLTASYRFAHPDVKVRFNVGATSTLARQIELGAAADFFLSADTVWSAYLVARLPGTSTTRLPITNSLVVVSAKKDFGSVAALESVKRVALADPSHVPAGRYAKEALECLNIWSSVKSRVVPTLDVRAALAAAVSGSVDAAIVYTTDIVSVSRMESFSSPIPSQCQSNILMDIVSLTTGDVAAWKEDWRDTILSLDNEAVWTAFGFQPQERD